jgi:hypothetical protein
MNTSLADTMLMNSGTLEWAIGRLAELRSEYAAGNARLAELARQREELRAVVLRIEGAIGVLEEQVARVPAFAENPAAPVG